MFFCLEIDFPKLTFIVRACEQISFVIKVQFGHLRDGDRYWYQAMLTDQEIAEVESTTLADIIRRNTSIRDEIDDDVFHVN